jgi:hypothetical protein
MKTKGLCISCENNAHCVLTQENGVLECEEFLGNGVVKQAKAEPRIKRAISCPDTAEEELQD